MVEPTGAELTGRRIFLGVGCARGLLMESVAAWCAGRAWPSSPTVSIYRHRYRTVRPG
jgi:hypothetical protein